MNSSGQSAQYCRHETGGMCRSSAYGTVNVGKLDDREGGREGGREGERESGRKGERKIRLNY